MREKRVKKVKNIKNKNKIREYSNRDKKIETIYYKKKRLKKINCII